MLKIDQGKIREFRKKSGNSGKKSGNSGKSQGIQGKFREKSGNSGKKSGNSGKNQGIQLMLGTIREIFGEMFVFVQSIDLLIY